jgi:nucleoside-diphosphate-sugar epimerase
MNEVIATIEQLAGRPLAVERHDVQRGDVVRTCADTTLARDVLGWRPATTLTDGLRAELDFVASRRDAMAEVAA